MEVLFRCPQCDKEAIIGFRYCVYCGRHLSDLKIQDGQLLLTDTSDRPKYAFAVRRGESEVMVSNIIPSVGTSVGSVDLDLQTKNGRTERVSLPMREVVKAIVEGTEIIDV